MLYKILYISESIVSFLLLFKCTLQPVMAIENSKVPLLGALFCMESAGTVGSL